MPGPRLYHLYPSVHKMFLNENQSSVTQCVDIEWIAWWRGAHECNNLKVIHTRHMSFEYAVKVPYVQAKCARNMHVQVVDFVLLWLRIIITYLHKLSLVITQIVEWGYKQMGQGSFTTYVDIRGEGSSTVNIVSKQV